MKFKATCSKSNQRFVLVVEASSIEIAKNDLHQQGYSIIQIDPFDGDTGKEEDFFYFDVIASDGTIQTGKIQSNDIFKAYVKLVEEMDYKVKYIYPMEGITEDEKMRITANVKSGYELSRKIDTDGTKALEMKRKAAEIKAKWEDIYENLPENIKKDLARYEKIIEDINAKIEKMLLENYEVIDSERQTRLRDLVQSLNQVKSSTNISRIHMIAEAALKKIGEIELQITNKRNIIEKEKYLEETNKLLKEIGSKDRIEAVKKEEAIDTIQRFMNNVFSKPTQDDSKKKIDKNTFVYFKNLRELNVYKKKLLETEITIMKQSLLLRFSQVKRLILKRRLLLQNIQIIENRITNERISYTKITRGFEHYVDQFLRFFYELGEMFLYAIFIFTIFYIFTEIVPIGYTMQPTIIQIIVFFSFFALLSRGMRDIILFLVSWLFLFFIVYFLSVNF